MRDLQKRVGDWHREAFPEPSYGNKFKHVLICEKVIEEAHELAEAGPQTFAEEAADVAIALMAVCSWERVDLESAIEAKMEINKGRVWTWDGDKFVRRK